MAASRKKKSQVTVVGSLNVDLIASVQRLPGAGETVAAKGLRKLFGGKGANQAIAAARQGASVEFVGCLGGDADGRAYRARMKSEGIGVTGIDRAGNHLTGSALIGIDESAENLIMVAPEANGQLSPAWISKKRRLIEEASVLLLQFEVPQESLLAAIRLANEAGVKVVLNPSPMNGSFPWGVVEIDFLIVNETEARDLFGLTAGTLKTRRRSWLAALEQHGIRNLIITRGGQTTLGWVDGALHEVPALMVKPVDTVGAGDAFAGAFAACLASGMEISRSLQTANAAGGLATLKPGAQEAIPNRRMVRTALSG